MNLSSILSTIWHQLFPVSGGRPSIARRGCRAHLIELARHRRRQDPCHESKYGPVSKHWGGLSRSELDCREARWSIVEQGRPPEVPGERCRAFQERTWQAHGGCQRPDSSRTKKDLWGVHWTLCNYVAILCIFCEWYAKPNFTVTCRDNKESINNANNFVSNSFCSLTSLKSIRSLPPSCLPS